MQAIGPTLTSPRSNVSAVVVRDRLYAVGGFSGKTFLNTIEYLDPETNEWTTFVSQQEIDLANIEQSLKEVVENGFHKSVSPIPPAVVEALQNGGDKVVVAAVNGHDVDQRQSSEEEEDVDEDVNGGHRRASVKAMNGGGGSVLFAQTSNGKLDEEEALNGLPRVADSDVDEQQLTKTTIVNGSS